MPPHRHPSRARGPADRTSSSSDADACRSTVPATAPKNHGGRRGEAVDARAERERLGGLLAAVQHHDERAAGLGERRTVEQIGEVIHELARCRPGRMERTGPRAQRRQRRPGACAAAGFRWFWRGRRRRVQGTTRPLSWSGLRLERGGLRQRFHRLDPTAPFRLACRRGREGSEQLEPGVGGSTRHVLAAGLGAIGAATRVEEGLNRRYRKTDDGMGSMGPAGSATSANTCRTGAGRRRRQFPRLVLPADHRRRSRAFPAALAPARGIPRSHDRR